MEPYVTSTHCFFYYAKWWNTWHPYCKSSFISLKTQEVCLRFVCLCRTYQKIDKNFRIYYFCKLIIKQIKQV